MNDYVNYIIEANIGLLIFLACYKWLLRGETNFRMLRIFLLTGIFTSLAFPLIHIQSNTNTAMFSIGQVLPAVVIEETAGNATNGTFFSFWTLLTCVYYGGVVFFFLTTIWQLSQLLRIISKTTTCRTGKYQIAESAENKSAFSFFNFIFIGQTNQLSETEKNQIIRHEMVHASQWHTLDILLVYVLKIFFWFNPFISTYKKTFIQLHEFEADARAVKYGGVDKYCSLLARVALQSADITLVNHFNNSLTVKRITMIRSIKNKMSQWKLVAFTILIPAMFVFLACQDQLNGKGETTLSSGDKVFTMVDEPATPDSGIDAFYDMVKKNLRYPAESRRNHIYGKVLIQFVVNEDGSLSDIELLESPDQILGEEAIRVLKLEQKWNPAKHSGNIVKQRLVMPIQFKLDFPGMEKQNVTQIENPEEALPQIVVVGYAN